MWLYTRYALLHAVWLASPEAFINCLIICIAIVGLPNGRIADVKPMLLNVTNFHATADHCANTCCSAADVSPCICS